MITYRRERWNDFIDELKPLAALHYEEVGRASPEFGPDINWALYEGYDQIGCFVSVIARADGEIVGYWGGVKHPDPHSRLNGVRMMMLSQAVLFVLPSWRFRVATRLIRTVENVARDLGVSVLTLESVTRRSGEFFDSLGYARRSVSHVKLIGAADVENVEPLRRAVG